MFIQILVSFLMYKSTVAQLNGEFWWLNDRLAKVQETHAPLPKFENISEFDTDESEKIIFRDTDLSFNPHRYEKNEDGKGTRVQQKISHQNHNIVSPTDPQYSTIHYEDILNSIKRDDIQNSSIGARFESVDNHDSDERDKIIFRDTDLILNTHRYEKDKDGEGKHVQQKVRLQNNKNKIVWPTDPQHYIKHNRNKNNRTGEQSENFDKHNTEESDKIFFMVNNEYTNNNTSDILSPTKVYNENVALFNHNGLLTEDPKEKPQSICTFMKKNTCYRQQGFIYQDFGKNLNRSPFTVQYICCILPLRATTDIDSGKLYFPDSIPKRYKRSNNEEISISLKQRNFLLQHKYSAQQTVTPSFSLTKSVNDDDYPDPYWNIKNKHFQDSNRKIVKDQSKYEYDDEEYTEELPKPGLVGLYSDQGKISPGWSFLGENAGSYGDDDYEDEDVPSFGYSTIDPRLGERKNKRHRRPVKLSSTTRVSSSDEITYNAESHTISYQSNPDFQVLQGFKLLNLFRNKSRTSPKNNKKNINRNDRENKNDDENTEHVLTEPLDSSSETVGISFAANEKQVFQECGIGNEPADSYEEDKQIGNAEEGTHPWLALVVRTKKKQDILCYATLIHPRAALTAADCVYGTSPNDVTLIAGLSDLSVKSGLSHRVPSIHLHSQYKPGNLAHDLSLLHWMQPLKLGYNIQPACVASPDPQENCFLFGWGGFDQAIRMRPRWQKASILSQNECISRLTSSKTGNELPPNAFCASVRSRGTVTGTGGPLICNIGGRQSTIGVAVWRDNVVVMLPAREWSSRVIEVLNSE